MSEVSTGAGLLPCPAEFFHTVWTFQQNAAAWGVFCETCQCFPDYYPTEAEAIAAWNQRTTPEPAADLVEIVARAMMAASRPNANPDDLTPAPRGTIGFVPKWRLFEHLARAAIAAIPGRCAGGAR